MKHQFIALLCGGLAIVGTLVLSAIFDTQQFHEQHHDASDVSVVSVTPHLLDGIFDEETPSPNDQDAEANIDSSESSTTSAVPSIDQP